MTNLLFGEIIGTEVEDEVVVVVVVVVVGVPVVVDDKDGNFDSIPGAGPDLLGVIDAISESILLGALFFLVFMVLCHLLFKLFFFFIFLNLIVPSNRIFIKRNLL